MNKTGYGRVSFGLATSALLVACVVLAFYVLALKTDLSRERENRAADAKRLETSSEQISTLQSELTSTRHALLDAQQKVDSNPSPSQSNPAKAITVIHINDVIKGHPEYAELYVRQVRLEVMRDYANVLATLPLTPNQLTELKDLLVAQRLTTNDAGQAAIDLGVMRGSGEYRTLLEQSTADIDRQISDLVAEEDFERLRLAPRLSHYEAPIVQRIAPALFDAGLPLTPTASAALVGIIASNSGTKSHRPDSNTWLSPADVQFLAEAEDVVSPEQLAVIQKTWIEINRSQNILSEYIPRGGTFMVEP